MSKYTPFLDDMRLEKVFELVSLTDSIGVLSLQFDCNGGEKLKVIFDSYLAYRKMDEGDAIKVLQDVAMSGCPARSLYSVKESEFALWFCEQTCATRSDDQFKHYSVHALNDIVDVLAIDPPVLVWL